MTLVQPIYKEEYKIFIGSSTESRPLAEYINRRFEICFKNDGNDEIRLTTVPWYEIDDLTRDISNLTLLSIFPKVLKTCEFSLFLLTPDDKVIKRGQRKLAVRDNVWFEAGMFIGSRGKDKTHFFINKKDITKLSNPSDTGEIHFPKAVNWALKHKQYFSAKTAFRRRSLRERREIERQIEEDVDNYCKYLIRRIKHQINNPVAKEEAIILSDGTSCFKEGIRMVNRAKKILYSTIAFKKSLSNPTIQEREMQKALGKKIRNIRKINLRFKRYMNCTRGHKGISDQRITFEKILKKAKLKPINSYLLRNDFDYLELIVSDDDVLMVFPDYTTGDPEDYEEVGFGFLIRGNKNLSHMIEHWLTKKIGSRK